MFRTGAQVLPTCDRASEKTATQKGSSITWEGQLQRAIRLAQLTGKPHCNMLTRIPADTASFYRRHFLVLHGSLSFHALTALLSMKASTHCVCSVVFISRRFVSVCGDIARLWQGKREEPTPLVLGHEGVGVIERIGTDIFSGQRPRNASWYLREGDRVTFSVADSCGTCPQCTLHKLPQKCVSLLKYGHTKLWHGKVVPGSSVDCSQVVATMCSFVTRHRVERHICHAHCPSTRDARRSNS